MDSSLYPYDRLGDRIKLARQVSAGPIIVVEGKTDRNFVSRIAPLSAADVYIAYTRNRVLDVAADLKRWGVIRAACVVDRDFDDAVGLAEAAGLPIAAYGNADLEAMLWSSPALDLLLEELGSDEKLARYGGTSALRQRAHDVLAPLTRLRRANAIHGWGINFDDLRLASKIDLSTLSIKIQSLCDALWNSDLDVKKQELYAVASGQDVPVCPVTGLHMIRGRDALAVGGAALRRLIGNLTHQQASQDRLEEVLRLAASESTLRGSDWLVRVEALLAA